MIALTLCDRSLDLVNAWRSYFPTESSVKILHDNILTVGADAIALPANSFGFTDGGVDMAISREVFDWGLQDRLRRVIDRDYYGELIVGQALVLPTNSARIRYVVVAPTMRVPADVSETVNAYLATRAVLLAADAHNASVAQPAERIVRLAIPGMGTGTGKMPVQRAAYQMWMGYRSLAMGDRDWTRSLDKQIEHDSRMRERS